MMKGVKFSTAAVLAVALTTFHCAQAAEFKKEQDCVVGAKVTDRQNKTGTVLKTQGGMCRLKMDGSGEEKSYLFWMLRPAGTSAAPTDKLVNGVYPCYSLSGSTLNYMFMDIVIEGPDRYRDKQGKQGKYKLDAATNKIVFESGPLTKANAKLLAGPKIGLNMSDGSFFNTTCSLKKK